MNLNWSKFAVASLLGGIVYFLVSLWLFITGNDDYAGGYRSTGGSNEHIVHGT